MKETHQKGEVERQLLEGEKTQLSEALARVRKSHNVCKNVLFANATLCVLLL